MSKHQRQVIREKIRDLLLQKTLAEDRIFTNRSNALFELELPCILIYTQHETSQKFTEAPRQLKRQLNLSVQAICQLEDNIDDLLDTFSLQIEVILGSDHFLEETVADSLLTETEVNISSDGKIPIGSITLHYQIDYYQYTPEENLPETENLDSIYNTIQSTENNTDIEISGQINFS